MSEQTFYIHKNTIPPYEYDKVISFIESYEPLVSINHIIETYLVLKLLKTEKEFAEFKYLISTFNNHLENQLQTFYQTLPCDYLISKNDSQCNIYGHL